VESTEARRLFTLLSGEYKVGPNKADAELPAIPEGLDGLARSGERAVAAIADQRRDTQAAIARYRDASRPDIQSLIAGYVGISAFARYLYLGADDATDFLSALSGPNGPLVDAVRKEAQAARAVRDVLESEARLRQRTRDLLDSHPRPRALTKSDLQVTHEVETVGPQGTLDGVVLRMHNWTSDRIPLHNVVIVTRMRPDAARQRRLAADRQMGELVSGVILTAATGVDARPLVAAMAAMNEARSAAAEVEQGDVYLVPEWMPKQELRLPLGPPSCAGAWASIEVSVWADEGAMSRAEVNVEALLADLREKHRLWAAAMGRKNRHDAAVAAARYRRDRVTASYAAERPSSRRSYGGTWVVRR
jgi:hypothetical protein